jgi:hypothetical protein
MRTFAIVAACAALAASAANATEQKKPDVPLTEKIAAAASEHRQKLNFDGKTFSGPAWDALVSEGKSEQFFLLGEEHGIAENPKFAAALFKALQPDYSRFMIEVSPPMATALDEAARGGVDGLKKMYATPGSEPAFYGMREEAQLLADVVKTARTKDVVLWGADYEVGGDRLLISELQKKSKPEAAEKALAALKAASDASWAQYETTHNPQFIYSFTGDPALVRAVRDAWPKRDAETSKILQTLEETFEINRLWVAGKGYASNERRSAFMRANFIDYWKAEKASRRTPKVFAKFGASHLVRGRNNSEVFDLGALIPEVAALEGKTAFRLLVLPGAGSRTAVFNPSTWRYEPGEPRNDYAEGLEPIVGAAFSDAFTLIDLRPLRPLLGRWREGTNPELMRVVHGFDAVLVLSGSTPSSNLRD